MDIRQGPHQVAQKSKSTGWPRKDSRRTAFPERSLSSKFGAAMTSPRRPLEQAAKRRRISPKSLGDQQRIQTLLDFRFGVHADELIDDFAAFEEEEGGNRR